MLGFLHTDAFGLLMKMKLKFIHFRKIQTELTISGIFALFQMIFFFEPPSFSNEKFERIKSLETLKKNIKPGILKKYEFFRQHIMHFTVIFSPYFVIHIRNKCMKRILRMPEIGKKVWSDAYTAHMLAKIN